MAASKGRRLDPEHRQAIEDDIRATVGTEAGSVRKTAERNGVSTATVRRIATAAGIEWCAESRDRVANAVEQVQRSFAERRTALAAKFLLVAEEALLDMDRAAVVFNFGGKDNTYAERKHPRPPTADRRNLVVIAATAVDKHKVLDLYDADARSGAAIDKWLEHLTGGPA